MSGLYQRALTLRKKKPQDEFTFDEDSGISKDDQKDILTEIEKVATQSRITITPEIFTIQALKKGILYPFMVTLFSIIILVAGIFTFYFLFQRGETILMEEGTAITSAEGKLIEELKKESEEKLLEKNKEISNIQSRLEEIDQEREDLKTNMEARVWEREQELRSSMEAELQAEREILKAEGISEEDINRRLRQLELEKSSEYNRQLEAFRRQAEEERIRAEDNLKALQEEYSNNLANANEERRRVLEESRKREDELRSQLAEKTEALESEKIQAERELRRINEQREKEELADSQLIGLYNTVQKNIRAGELDQALLNLNGIRDYLNDETIVALPGMLKRREVEFFVVDSISNLVEAEMKKTEVDTASLIASAKLVTEIKNMVLEADSFYRRGEIEEAEKMYKQALGLIPEINRSYNFFKIREEEAEDARQKKLEEYLEKAETAFRNDNYTETLDNYTKALAYLPEDPATIERMISQARQSGFELGIEHLEQQHSGRASGPLAEADSLFSREQNNEAIFAYIDIIAKYPYSFQVESALQGINRTVEAKSNIARGKRTELQNTLGERTKALEDNLKTKIGELESIQKEKKVLADEIESLRSEIEELQQSQSSSPVTAELDETIQNKISRLEKIQKNYNAIIESYAQYTAREDSILTSLGEDGLIESKLHLNAFLASTEESFPGLWDRIKRYDAAFEQAGRSSTLQDINDIVYELSLRSRPVARELFLETEMVRYQDDPIMVKLLEELKTLIKR